MKSLFWSTIRIILSGLILFFNWVFTPKSVKREAEAQAKINEATQDLTLYQYKACPFCVKVRRSMKRSALDIQTKDAKRCENSKQELVTGGGQLKVPCLRIIENGEEKWMYESKEIISYLNGRFGQAA
ncbi:MAG: glutaredoxin [Bermanella sp.]|jgi:glutaredoxin